MRIKILVRTYFALYIKLIWSSTFSLSSFLEFHFRFSPLPPWILPCIFIFNVSFSPHIPLFPCIYVFFPFKSLSCVSFSIFFHTSIQYSCIFSPSIPPVYIFIFHSTLFKDLFPFHLSITFSVSFHLRYLKFTFPLLIIYLH